MVNKLYTLGLFWGGFPEEERIAMEPVSKLNIHRSYYYIYLSAL